MDEKELMMMKLVVKVSELEEKIDKLTTTLVENTREPVQQLSEFDKKIQRLNDLDIHSKYERDLSVDIKNAVMSAFDTDEISADYLKRTICNDSSRNENYSKVFQIPEKPGIVKVEYKGGEFKATFFSL